MRGNRVSEEERRYRAELGARIRLARRSRRMTALRLAALCGMLRNCLSAYERGIAVPSSLRLRKMATALGVHPAWLVWGEREIVITGAAKIDQELVRG
jgi:transcriptional regulator with XRE-family HTH domain